MPQNPARFRRTLIGVLTGGCVVVAGVAAVLWFVTTFYGSVGIFSLGDDTSLRFRHGAAEVHQFYEYNIAPAVPSDQWHTTAVSRGWTMPPTPNAWDPLSFRFSRGNVSGIGSASYGAPTPAGVHPSGMISPARYWLLRVPLWPFTLPGFVLAALLLARWGRGRDERRRGFMVEAPAKVA